MDRILKSVFVGVIGLLGLLYCTACDLQWDNTAAVETQSSFTLTPGTIQVDQEMHLVTLEQLRNRWISGTPCAPPCWEGITPGQTSADEAIEILISNPMITNVDDTYFSMYDQVSFQLPYQDEYGDEDILSGRFICDHLP
ncbi:MAG TPA: hypothetical protein VLM83_10855, partial [Anaerolineales bacterium]|nr:hypothetical protein [Anaerolineales bacterium]